MTTRNTLAGFGGAESRARSADPTHRLRAGKTNEHRLERRDLFLNATRARLAKPPVRAWTCRGTKRRREGRATRTLFPPPSWCNGRVWCNGRIGFRQSEAISVAVRHTMSERRRIIVWQLAAERRRAERSETERSEAERSVERRNEQCVAYRYLHKMNMEKW